jgi:hypothetical protein
MADQSMARAAVRLPNLGGPSGAGAAAAPCYTPTTDFHANGAATEAITEARAKRLAFVQALARQTARELAAQALAARDA